MGHAGSKPAGELFPGPLSHCGAKTFLSLFIFVLAVSTGFTGAFTTFSAVSVETENLASVNPLFSLVYVAVSFFAGLLLACAGRSAGNLTSAAIEEKLSAREVRSVE